MRRIIKILAIFLRIVFKIPQRRAFSSTGLLTRKEKWALLVYVWISVVLVCSLVAVDILGYSVFFKKAILTLYSLVVGFFSGWLFFPTKKQKFQRLAGILFLVVLFFLEVAIQGSGYPPAWSQIVWILEGMESLAVGVFWVG